MKNRIETGALCCECYNCVNCCPKNAITIEYDDFEIPYPDIDTKKCIDCYLCKKVCPINSDDPSLLRPEKAYAFFSKDKNAEFSSSGGAFYELAKRILSEGGLVIGARFTKNLSVEYALVDNIRKLDDLQGSKYVCSYVGSIFQTIKEKISLCQTVLFVGTPCHVSALKNSLGSNADSQYLLTIDLICHGTPPRRLFLSYIKYLGWRKKKEIVSYRFRSKRYKRRVAGEYGVYNRSSIKWKVFFLKEDSFFTMFINRLTLNECCYDCKYTQPQRVGDITLGDFWGVESVYPSFFSNNNIPFGSMISAVMINSNKGNYWFSKINDNICVQEASYDEIVKRNPSLFAQPQMDINARNEIRALYSKYQYKGIEKYFRNHSSILRYSHRIKAYLGLIKNE